MGDRGRWDQGRQVRRAHLGVAELDVFEKFIFLVLNPCQAGPVLDGQAGNPGTGNKVIEKLAMIQRDDLLADGVALDLLRVAGGPGIMPWGGAFRLFGRMQREMNRMTKPCQAMVCFLSSGRSGLPISGLWDCHPGSGKGQKPHEADEEAGVS